jgi:uncharacterized protein with PhoU and TrkA domain
VAEIPKRTISEVLELMGKLLKLINTAAHSELSAFNKYGETGQIAYVLEQLQNVKEKAVSTYTRLSTIVLKISETQPTLTPTMMGMLIKAIEQAKATVSAGEASINEVKSEWRL